MDGIVIMLLAVTAAVIIILCVVLVKVLKGIGNATHSANRIEDRGELEKTEHIGTRANNAGERSKDEVARQLVFEEIPVLPKHNNKDVQRKIAEKEKPKAVLKYMENDKLMEYEMYTEFINIGRDPDICHLVISGDNSLGKFHAILFNKKNRFYVVDVNSKNGTYIGNVKIEGSAQISGSCKMRFAKTEIEFIVLDGGDSAH